MAPRLAREAFTRPVPGGAHRQEERHFALALCSIPDVLLRIKNEQPRLGKTSAGRCFFDWSQGLLVL